MMMNALQVNPIGAMLQGQQAASQSREMARQNALNQLYQTQGAGIAQGNPEALNALAALDPMAAAQMRQQENALNMRREEMDMRRDNMAQDNARADAQLAISQEGLEMKREQARQQAEAQVAQMSALERQQEAEKIRQGLTGAIRFYEAGDEAGYNQYLQSIGVDPAEAPFAQFPEVAAAYDGVLEALQGAREARQGPKPADEYGRYVREEKRAGREPLGRIEYAQAKKGKEIIYGPDGQVIVERGPGNSMPKLTVEAAKNTGYLIRMQEANQTLGNLEEEGLRLGQQILDKVPLGVGNYARDPEFQQFDQARRDFINAILRRESGAVISDAEFDNANKQYFPVPGDSPEVIAQKRRNRENAIAGLEVGSGDGAAYARDRAPAPAPQQQPEQASPSQTYRSFEEFAGNADVQAKAEEYGVSVEEMWDILRGGE